MTHLRKRKLPKRGSPHKINGLRYWRGTTCNGLDHYSESSIEKSIGCGGYVHMLIAMKAKQIMDGKETWFDPRAFFYTTHAYPGRRYNAMQVNPIFKDESNSNTHH